MVIYFLLLFFFKIQDELQVEAKSLKHYQRDIEELSGFAQNLTVMVKQLKVYLYINHTSLKDAIYSLMNEVVKAQDYLNKDGSRKLLEVHCNPIICKALHFSVLSVPLLISFSMTDCTTIR